jgi:hypothetical protein
MALTKEQIGLIEGLGFTTFLSGVSSKLDALTARKSDNDAVIAALVNETSYNSSPSLQKEVKSRQDDNAKIPATRYILINLFNRILNNLVPVFDGQLTGVSSGDFAGYVNGKHSLTATQQAGAEKPMGWN